MLHDCTVQPVPRQNTSPRWRCEWEAAAVGLLVLAIYLPRLTVAPVCGEESRWATAAREMIASGDFIVPRQQGKIFPERPPLGSWMMALVGAARGNVDLVAIRLPSVLATLLTSLLIYAYARLDMSRAASAAAALVFATFGQVLPLGRFGESEALFTLFVSAALLTWHAGYVRGWPAAITWSLGYSLAGLGALVKGPQAPVYFVAVTAAYLLWKRDWRFLFAPGQLAGLASLALVVGAWMVPFALSNRESVGAIWTGLARQRFTTAGLATHLATFPLETFGCLLPWSPLLFALASPRVRRSIFVDRPQARFLVVALAITYPSLWLAAGARGRYFMPLYPCVAILIALVVEHCTSDLAAASQRLFWRRYVRSLAVAVAGGAAALVVVRLLPDERLAAARQGWAFLGVWTLAAMLSIGVLIWATSNEAAGRAKWAMFTIAGFIGLAYTGAMLNARAAGGNDLAPITAQLKSKLADPRGLVSLRPIYHRFAFVYGEPIRQIPWPASPADVSADVNYFCFDRWPGYFDPPDNSTSPSASSTAPLPFEWEKIAEIGCDPVQRAQQHNRVVIGRIRRPAPSARSESAALPESALPDSRAQPAAVQPATIARPAASRAERR